MPERVVRVYNPSTEETEAGRTGTQGYSMTQTKYEASLLCMRPCLKKAKKIGLRETQLKKKKPKRMKSNIEIKIHKTLVHGNMSVLVVSDSKTLI